MSDLTVRIIINNTDSITHEFLIKILSDLEHVLYLSDRDDIKYLCQSLDVPDVYRDAMLERIREFKNRRVELLPAEQGSWIIEAVVLGTPLYVFKITIADSLKESGIVNGIKREFKRVIDEKSLQVLAKMQQSKIFSGTRISRIQNVIRVELVKSTDRKPKAERLSKYIDSDPL